MYSAHSPQEYLDRMDGIEAAHQALVTEHGLTAVNALEVGGHIGLPLDYAVFKGPTAMPIGVGRE